MNVRERDFATLRETWERLGFDPGLLDDGTSGAALVEDVLRPAIRDVYQTALDLKPGDERIAALEARRRDLHTAYRFVRSLYGLPIQFADRVEPKATVETVVRRRGGWHHAACRVA